MADFVDVYAKATGKKHRVPAHWLEHATLGQLFRKTPKVSAAETRALGSATPATDVVTATPANPDTPAAGDKE